jgi:hypothetical protein
LVDVWSVIEARWAAHGVVIPKIAALSWLPARLMSHSGRSPRSLAIQRRLSSGTLSWQIVYVIMPWSVLESWRVQ